MSELKTPEPAKLVIGLFMQEKRLLAPLTQALEVQFGPIDIISRWFDFNFTSYYTPEMGSPLFRRIVTFKHLIRQDELPDIKIATQSLEQTQVVDARRRVNIDPGYLVLERFVLATGKNFTHRIYLRQGVYADLTLLFQKGRFRSLPWTYPDYRSSDLTTFLTQVRNKYRFDLKQRTVHSAESA